jgi:large subunit ribosomal protein L5
MSDEKKQKKQQPAEKAGKGKAAPAAAPAAAGRGKRVHDSHVKPRLAEAYREKVVPALMKRFEYKSVMQVPRLEKIVLNMGMGDATQDPKLIEMAVRDLEAIAGQKAVVTRAKKSISNFKLREGMPIGCRVTLRRARMFEFLDRFISVTIPRLRDFRGLPDRSFDGRGNYTIGVKEHVVFPEIDVDKITKILGLDITIVTTARTDQEAHELLRGFGMPFVKRQDTVAPQAA